MSKKLLLVIGGIVVVAVVLAMYVMGVYNNLVTARENADNQWAQVETQYQRRFDLIPNLVNSVKGAMTQEQEIFTAIADARTRYAGAATVSDKAEAATQVESALGRLLVIMENYPQLQSTQAVRDLMTQLEGTENRISVERKRFNDSARDYNVMVQRVPTSMIAGLFGFETRSYFEVAAGVENAPAVNL